MNADIFDNYSISFGKEERAPLRQSPANKQLIS
uniref:Uncharacterized protein n=1 Tax=Encephalitozoon cuniculi TaxID=6035 RepID=M1KMS8_ENCCN|nr:hypothetical protein ECU06_1700 [Encephalitozoon cuniculi]